MPRKPSQTYGHISFGKDGRVAKHVHTLSSDAKGQEAQIAAMFCTYFFGDEDGDNRWELLSECDHDFVMHFEDGDVIVQVTEAAPFQYLTRLSDKQYQEGTHSSRHFLLADDGKTMLGVDIEKRDQLIAELIRKKRDKCYAKPNDSRFWLCIFSNDPMLIPEVMMAGKRTKTKAMEIAQAYCREHGIEPFDEVWFQFLGLPEPHGVWP